MKTVNFEIEVTNNTNHGEKESIEMEQIKDFVYAEKFNVKKKKEYFQNSNEANGSLEMLCPCGCGKEQFRKSGFCFDILLTFHEEELIKLRNENEILQQELIGNEHSRFRYR